MTPFPKYAGGCASRFVADAYLRVAREAWEQQALDNALENLGCWTEMSGGLEPCLVAFRQDARTVRLGDLSTINDSGSLEGYLYKLNDLWSGNRSELRPFLDYERRRKVVFLRRGLVLYCKLALEVLEYREVNGIEAGPVMDPNYGESDHVADCEECCSGPSEESPLDPLSVSAPLREKQTG